ncbi:heparinase II/III family protein [Thiocapsa marina]|uniref:Heparinase II/III family protein n=1 Tax=Thiocapsa marina 5811 TaxID=768671 RepID=F9U668_9GAMM|nr:heparinase II/III family protein [Thiocapsa marina]EGV20641.1 Heparinase II/III family protein [Thiocapsa marina 5811]
MLLRYWHTLRHLRPVQFYGRLWFRLYRPRPDLRPAPGLRAATGAWVAPTEPAVSMQGPETFRFLNAEHRVLGPSAWNDPSRDKLWLYNLHYFDDLNALDAAARADWHRALLQRWVAENPPVAGNGWEPYPTSLRIVNWIKWALAGNELPPDCVQSLAVQTRWLRRRLEHHLLGNHLFANAKALVFAGAFFVGPESDRWLAAGRRLLARELHEQILPDGGHFERSPMYHAILLDDVLDLIDLAGAYPDTAEPAAVAFYRDRADAMTSWLQAMCHPDGEIGFFNDAAFGIAPTLAQLTDYRRRLGFSVPCRAPDFVRSSASSLSHAHAPPNPCHAQEGERPTDAPGPPNPGLDPEVPLASWVRDSGYVRLEAGSALALLDVAPIGPDYLPGHAHADTLSFELSLFGQRVIVNGGTSRYGSGSERLAERGTAAHSTVQIDGADSSEVWGGFRVARRARPSDVRVETVPNFGRDQFLDRDTLGGASSEPGRPAAVQLRVSAAHDGYRRLPGRPLHRRTWEMTADRLTVTDRLEGEYGKAIARFHLHPQIQADGGGMQGHLLLPAGQSARWSIAKGQARLVPDLWHPEFGRSLPAQCLEVEISDGECTMVLDWG